ncbi:MAG TPA: DNA-binding response regulator [Erysipelotrichaceae bacterium]|nr:DNA-binding response regulator [Erysipelotrichaceae bacterium]
MNPFKILVVEDDRSVSNLITTTLKLNQYSYLRASGGQEAVSICASAKPDLILLDLGLPDMDGISVIETIRSWSQVPIIVISARSEETDKISALDSGADDYLTKPFSVDELMARIRVSQRRIQYQPASEETVFINGELSIDFASAEVKVRDNVVHLTPIEYKLLCLLARNTGKVLTHTYIISNIWGTGIDNDIVSLRVYMTSLRKKLNTENDLIRTHIGIGYQMIRI